LLLAQRGSVNETDEAVDLGQDPADLIFLSAADTELAALAHAQSSVDVAQVQSGQNLSVRLANMMQLSHPMSVDVYAENTVAKSRMLIARVLGGESYFQYGLEKLFEIANANNVKLVVLPGDDKPDPSLARFNTVSGEVAERSWEYLNQGGPENMANLLGYVRHLLDGGEEPSGPVPLMKAGVWSPVDGICDLARLRKNWLANAAVVAICFYRALVQSGGLQPVEAIVDALRARNINVLPLFISSLKDPVSVEIVRSVFSEAAPSLVLNATGFAVSSPANGHQPTVLDETGCPVFQIVFAGGSREAWENSDQGLSARDLAMNVALPEVDGRVFTRAVAFKNATAFDEASQSNIVVHEAHQQRVDFVADFVANWVRLQQADNQHKRVGIILANYPNRDGRLGNGVGLDTPAGTINVLQAMREAGFETGAFPDNGDGLIEHLQEGPTNAATDGRLVRETISLNQYKGFFESLPKVIQRDVLEHWGEPEADPFFMKGDAAFALSVSMFGKVAVGIQPARGYNIDPTDTYHSPDLVPPHGYLAFYAWLSSVFEAHAIVHMGKHGNLEWLPGKALSLSETCYPEAVMGPVPNFYPFIVNDPGEGTQAKRRLSSVIIDHLTPPLTRAESYGPLRDLEALVDEYYDAAGNDPRRLKLLKKQILELIEDIGLDTDAGIAPDDGDMEKLEKLDGYLCELKEMQIRDGLHVFGISPEGRLKHDLVTALVRVPRGQGEGKDQSLQRAIAIDLGLDFDPLDCDMAGIWRGNRSEILMALCEDPWRSNGDTVERIEMLAVRLVDGELDCPADWSNTSLVLSHVKQAITPSVDACGMA
ncbi:MAG: cobaltochelatase subunit CobN, partial [Pseudomonadota bacterium]